MNDNGGIVLGKEAGIVVNQEFGSNVLTAFNGLIDLSKSAGELILTTTDKANKSAQDSISAVTSAIQNDKLGTSTTESNLVKYIPLLIGAGVVIFVFVMIFNRKKG